MVDGPSLAANHHIADISHMTLPGYAAGPCSAIIQRRSYPTFTEFKSAIQHCLETANSEHQSKLESLLALNFQTFGKAQGQTT